MTSNDDGLILCDDDNNGYTCEFIVDTSIISVVLLCLLLHETVSNALRKLSVLEEVRSGRATSHSEPFM